MPPNYLFWEGQVLARHGLEPIGLGLKISELPDADKVSALDSLVSAAAATEF